jgi:hypothetical protein
MAANSSKEANTLPYGTVEMIRRIFCATSVALLALLSPCSGHAAVTSIFGHWGTGGYSVVDFTVSTAGRVDFQYTGGYGDPTFSIFDSSGSHLISNDDDLDVPSLFSHLTQILATGHYSLLVSYSAESISYAESLNGADFSYSDGFNYGSYWTGGTGTLMGMTSHLDSISLVNEGQAFALDIIDTDNVVLGNNANPEPASLVIWGLGALGCAVGAYRRLKKAQAT